MGAFTNVAVMGAPSPLSRYCGHCDDSGSVGAVGCGIFDCQPPRLFWRQCQKHLSLTKIVQCQPCRATALSVG